MLKITDRDYLKYIFIIAISFSISAIYAQFLPFENSQTGEKIPADVESMYLKGLGFLVSTQNENGTWEGNYGAQPGVVGLCLIAMLAHGDDPNNGKYSIPIKKALNFILNSAKPGNGYLGESMYNHGFATLALAESYGMLHDKRIGPALQKAVKLILTAQINNPRGAWRYSPESNDADTTVSGALMVALFAAANAGIEVPASALNRAYDFYLSCQAPDGGFGYTTASGPNLPRTAIGVVVYSLGDQNNSDAYKKAFKYLDSRVAEGEVPSNYYFYYLYYAAQAFFHNANPEKWKKWNEMNIQNLKRLQADNGSWNGNLGIVFSTSAALLSLALNYRFLPIYERKN
jgi:hypothetical protein